MKTNRECFECGCGAPEYQAEPWCGSCKAWREGYVAGQADLKEQAANRAQELAHKAEGAVLRCERDRVEQVTMEFYRGRSEAFRKVEDAIRAILVEVLGSEATTS